MIYVKPSQPFAPELPEQALVRHCTLALDLLRSQHLGKVRHPQAVGAQAGAVPLVARELLHLPVCVELRQSK